MSPYTVTDATSARRPPGSTATLSGSTGANGVTPPMLAPLGTTDAERRYAAALGGVTRWATVVDWSNNGGRSWQPATFLGGSATCSATAQIRWVAQIRLADVPFGLGGINPYQTRFRIRHGLRFSSHEMPQLMGLGVYAVTSASRSTTKPGEIAIEGQSFEVYLIRSAFTRPRTFPAGDAAGLLMQLIREVLPSAAVDWHTDVRNVALPRVTVDRDRWGMIDGSADARSIAKSLGARVAPDGDGVWTVAPVASLQDPPAWEATEGPGGVLLSKTEQLSSDNVENAQIVSGTPTGSIVIGPVVVKDLDPQSLTYTERSPDQGGFGLVPAEPYTSQLITARWQAEKVAQTRLAARLGLKQQLTFDSLHDPSKRPGQVGIVHGFQPQRAILDSVTFDLSAAPGPLQCETRTTATTLAGDVADFAEAS